METSTGTYKLQRPVAAPVTDSLSSQTAAVVVELMNATIATHKLHLKVSGAGAYAAHMALGGFYGELPALVDGIAEGFQGVHETILDLSAEKAPKALNSVEECVNYLRELYTMVADLQAVMPHSEIVNDLDVIKSLINTTKYKLLYLQ